MKTCSVVFTFFGILALALAWYFDGQLAGISENITGPRESAIPRSVGAAPNIYRSGTDRLLKENGHSVASSTNDQLREQRRKLLADALPTGRELNIASDRIRVRAHFASLYAQLGLSASDIERFELAAAASYDSMNVFSVVLGQYPPEREAALIRGLAKNLYKVVESTLGEDAVEAFQLYIKTADIQKVVSDFTTHAQSAGVHVTSQEARDLLETILKNTNYPGNRLRISPSYVDWQAVSSSAKLGPEQYKILQNIVRVRELDAEFKKTTGLPYRQLIRGI